MKHVSKNFRIVAIGTASLALSIAACGKSHKEQPKGPTRESGRFALITTSVAKLSTCDANMNGALAYVSEEQSFYVCENATWQKTALGSGGQASIDYLVKTIKPKAEGAVFDIECDGAEGQSRGTGTKINDTQIITAAHVIQGCQRALFRSNKALVAAGGLPIRAKSGRDIAIIEPKDFIGTGWETLPSLPPSKGWKPTIGAFLMLVSLPEIIISDKQYSFGHVTDDQVNSSLQTSGDPGQWRNAFMSDMAASGGSSGAPLFNVNGEFVGIHVGGFKDGLELNYQLAFEDGDFGW